MHNSLTIISNDDNKTYFKSNNHCQKHGNLTGYIPCTHYYPSNVVPRELLPDGIIKSDKDIINVFYTNYTEIENPIKE